MINVATYIFQYYYSILNKYFYLLNKHNEFLPIFVNVCDYANNIITIFQLHHCNYLPNNIKNINILRVLIHAFCFKNKISREIKFYAKLKNKNKTKSGVSQINI